MGTNSRIERFCALTAVVKGRKVASTPETSDVWFRVSGLVKATSGKEGLDVFLKRGGFGMA